MRDALAALEEWRGHLHRIRGVVATGVTRGEEGEPAIAIYVESLEEADLGAVPAHIMGFKVVVKEIGRVELFALRPPELLHDRTARWRPAPGGVSIGSPDITAGTLGCVVRDARTGRRLILSNNHVLAQNWGWRRDAYEGKPALQPAVYDGGRDPDDRLGTLLRWVDVDSGKDNLVDAAVALPVRDADVSDEVLDLGVPGPVAEPEVGMRVAKSGRSCGTRVSTVEAVGVTVDVWGWGVCRFVDQVFVTNPFGIPGDSGSWVCEAGTGRTVGLLFAGSPRITVLNKAANVEELLGVRFGAAPAVAGAPWFIGTLATLGPIGVAALAEEVG